MNLFGKQGRKNNKAIIGDDFNTTAEMSSSASKLSDLFSLYSSIAANSHDEDNTLTSDMKKGSIVVDPTSFSQLFFHRKTHDMMDSVEVRHFNLEWNTSYLEGEEETSDDDSGDEKCTYNWNCQHKYVQTLNKELSIPKLVGSDSSSSVITRSSEMSAITDSFGSWEIDCDNMTASTTLVQQQVSVIKATGPIKPEFIYSTHSSYMCNSHGDDYHFSDKYRCYHPHHDHKVCETRRRGGRMTFIFQKMRSKKHKVKPAFSKSGKQHLRPNWSLFRNKKPKHEKDKKYHLVEDIDTMKLR